MSAIVAAAQRLEDRRIDAVLGRAFVTGERLRAMQVAAGDVLVDASNAACRAMVVEGAPRTWAVRWSPPLWSTGLGWIARDGWRNVLAFALSPSADLRPCWNAGSRLWVWSTAAHDPRPCAWPRPFARGA